MVMYRKTFKNLMIDVSWYWRRFGIGIDLQNRGVAFIVGFITLRLYKL